VFTLKNVPAVSPFSIRLAGKNWKDFQSCFLKSLFSYKVVLLQIMIPDYLELIRLCFGMHPIDVQVIFLLIIVDRDDDAYNLIKSGAIKQNSFFISASGNESYKGDWIYLTGQDKTEDFYNVLKMIFPGSGWHYSLALVALKMKTINDMKGRAKLFDYFAEELDKAPQNSLAKRVAHVDIMDCIEPFVVGYKRSKIDQQEEHLQMYLKEISRNDEANILQDLLDSNVMSKFHANPFIEIHFYVEHPEYYDDFIKYAFQVFKHIPGALETLKKFHPSY
jgi:hypothetical protein